MKEYIDKSDVNGLVQIGWSGDAIVTAIINDGVSSVPAIPIPDGATNGDMIKAMFPNIEMWGESEKTLDYSLGGMIHRITKSWWNSPFRKEVEE